MIRSTVKLGLMPPLTGLVGIYGTEIVRAGQIACQEINEKGGVLGRPLELLIEDDGSMPDSAVLAAEKLIDRHGCAAIVGNLLSNSRIAVAYSVAEPRKIPLLNFSFYEGSILSRYFFHFAALPNQQIDRMIPYMHQKFGPRMFFAGNNYEWPRGSIDAAKRVLKYGGGEVVGEEYCPIGVDIDLIDKLLDQVEDAAPDVFVPYFAGADQVNLLTRFTERGLKKHIAVVMGHYDELMASKLTPEIREGFYSSNTYFMTVDTAQNQDYLRRLENQPGVNGVWPHGNGILTNFGEGAYLCVKAFAQAANEAGSIDAESLVDALKAITLSSPQGEVQMNSVHQHARVNTYLSRCRRDGVFEIVENFGVTEPVMPELYSHQGLARESSVEDEIRLQSRMLEKMSDAVILVDSQNGSIIFANSSAEKMFAYDKNEMLGNSIANFNLSGDSESDVDRTFTGIASHLKKRGEWQGEVRAEKRNGETICCDFNISTFTHPDPFYGEVWLWVVSDITQRKNAENELQRERDFANNLLNTAPMVVLLLDLEGYVKYINPYFERLSGYQLNEVMDKDWFSTFLPERDHDSIRKLFRQAKHDVPTEGNLNPIVTRSGEERQIKWNDRCIYDPQGNISGVLAVGQDVTDQYFVEKELQQFKNTLDQTLDCVFMFDESLRFTYFNEGAMQQVGYTQNELLFMSPYDIKPNITEEDFRILVAPLLAGEQASISFETVHQHKDGNLVPVEIFLQYIKAADEPGRFVAIVRDITERKLAEQSLQAASEINQKIISESPIGMAIYNSTGQCITANTAVATMVGATKEQVLAQNYRQIASWKDSGLLDVANKSIALQEKQRAEVKLTTTFDKQVFIDCLLVPFRSRGEQHLLLMIDDISERKLAEQELENLFELSLDMVATGNLQGYFAKVNSSFTRILGYNREELFSQPFTALVYEEDLDATVSELQKAAAGESKLYLVNRYKCKDGGLKWIEWNVLADVKENTFYATGRDITQRKEAEAELTTYRQKLEELVDERTRELKETQNELVRKERLATLGQLTATVSHELRNPLGAMRPSLFIVDKNSDRSNSRVQNALSRIDRNIDRCDHIIDELLDFTRITDLARHPDHFDAWLASLIDEQDIPANVQVERDFTLNDMTVTVDYDRLRRVLINVIDNACHAMMEGSQQGEVREGSILKIKTACHEDSVRIQIEDNGSGMPPDVLAKIFEPLFSTKGFGVGLGMPTVKQIMEQHGGGIEVESEEGKGTTISLWLPLAQTDSVTPRLVV